MEAAWSRVTDVLREKIGSQNLETWFRPALFLGVHDSRALLQLPNKFFVDWITDHYQPALLESLQQVLGTDVRGVTLRVNPNPQGELFPKSERRTDPTSDETPRRAARRGGLVARYTFANFVVGASNKFAHAAAEAVANKPGEHYNPLFIYGGVGLGKTHLINAIGHQVLERATGAKVGYFSAESFMNELITAIREKHMDDFKNRFRKLDVLILDDVQFLAGREQTQVEFFHTFNTLHESHRQIVLSSDKFPKDIPQLEERLRNRFEWGLIADIQAPDIETRVAILLKKAEAEALPLGHDVALFLASKFEANIRELEGSLTRLGALASFLHKPITVEFAREVLKDLVKDRHLQVTVESVQQVVCAQFAVKLSDIKSPKRTRNLAFARQVCMYLCRKLAGASLPSIGEKFGNRDHSTVIHAIQVVEKRREEDPGFHSTLESLERLVEGQGRV
jgi:chromosomal replication initiator protein